MARSGSRATSRQTRCADLPCALQEQLASAIAALEANKADEAVIALTRVLARVPDHAETLRLFGIAERQRGRTSEALTALRRAAALRPDDALIQGSLGGALAAVGDNAEAIEAYRRACNLAPHLAAAWNNLGKALSDGGRIPEAIEALDRAISLAPELLPAHFSLAYTHTVAGHAASAADCYRAVLARRADDGEAWLGLARTDPASLEARAIATLQKLFSRVDLEETERIAIGFALGYVQEQHRDFANAFETLIEANALVRQRCPWDAGAFSARLDAILAAPRPRASAPGDFGQEAIFIVGMPRSGTTLVEQMLAAHSKIEAAGETTTMSELLGAESKRRGKPFAEWLGDLDAGEWRDLGRSYLDRARPHAVSGAHFIDKLPGNWLYLDAIAAMLPGARVIVCRRDPLETCFSCFRQRFAEGRQAFAYDLDDIAAWWHDFDRATRHWILRYPETVFELQHERLLDDTESEMRALLSFCDLDFEDACMRPRAGSHAVRTLSAIQVRAPLRRGPALTSLYGTVLDPLRHALRKKTRSSNAGR